MLETFDFSSVRVNVICLEADGHSPEKDEAVKAFLVGKGFLYHGHIDRNDWFVHQHFKPSKNPTAEARRQDMKRIQGETWAGWANKIGLGPEEVSRQGANTDA